MIAILINPPLPNPVTARPNKKIARDGAAAVMKRPIAKMVLEKTKQRRAVKIVANRPANGVTLEAAIFKQLDTALFIPGIPMSYHERGGKPRCLGEGI